MNDTVKIIASGKNFSYAVKLLKKRGGKFDEASKTWAVPAGSMSDATEYVRKVVPVDAGEAMYRDWSDNPNSSL